MRVLLAEDDRRIANFIIKGLREEGYVVEHVLDGESAIEFALAEPDYPFDIIILDLNMPIMDGIQSCKSIRKF